MRLEYIRSFADSAQNVMQSVMPSAVSQGAVTLKDSLSAHGISATIFLVGGVEGRVVLDLDPRWPPR